MRVRRWTGRRAARGCLVVSLCVSAAACEAQSTDFAGRTLHIVVGSGPGGGLDVYARALAPHLAAALPGKPNIVVENMPGAIGLAAMNWLARSAPRDGTAIVASSNVAVAAPLFGSKAAQFDPRTLGAIGSMARQHSVCATWTSSPVKTLDDARRSEVVVGADAAGSRSATIPALLNTLIGTKFKVVVGYATTDVGLALERGEIEGVCGLSWSTLKAAHPDWIRNRRLNVLLQTGETAQSDLPNAPVLGRLVTNEDDRRLLRLLAFPDEVGRPYLTSPEVPAARLDALRHAFDAAMRDPGFLEDAQREGLDVDPMSGAVMSQTIAAAYASPPDLVARAARWAGD